jgi:hypothetical protein
MKDTMKETLEEALKEFERIKKNRFISNEMLDKMKSILKRIGEYGPPQGAIEVSSACAFCDMGQAGYSFRGDGFHDDECAVKDAQLLYKEMFVDNPSKP